MNEFDPYLRKSASSTSARSSTIESCARHRFSSKFLPSSELSGNSSHTHLTTQDAHLVPHFFRDSAVGLGLILFCSSSISLLRISGQEKVTVASDCRGRLVRSFRRDDGILDSWRIFVPSLLLQQTKHYASTTETDTIPKED